MVDRQQSSRNLLSEEEQGFDHGITALLLIFFGGCCSLLGATMTGLAYAYEKREHFTSVAEGYGLRTDIAGPVLLSIGSAGFISALVMITAFGVCAPPAWTNRKVSGAVEAVAESGRY